MKKTIIVEIKKCLGCKTCELACAVEHSKSKKLEEAINECPLPQNRVFVEYVGTATIENLKPADKTIQHLGLSFPLQCSHCEDAPCVKICPTKALQLLSDEGIVILSSELCIGCKSCIFVCTFGVIKLGPDGKAITKCDLCINRLRKGLKPACVSSCPTKALKFVSVEDLPQEIRKNIVKKFISEIFTTK